jgi:hypothetical protein
MVNQSTVSDSHKENTLQLLRFFTQGHEMQAAGSNSGICRSHKNDLNSLE